VGGSLVRCEICGSIIRGKPRKALVEGAILLVCEECAAHSSQIISTPSRARPSKPLVSLPLPRERPPTRRKAPPVRGIISEEYMIVEDYGGLIKRAREQRGWTQEDLAFKIGEKASFIGKLETGKVYPSFEVARKLEHALGIKLITRASEAGLSQAQAGGESQTTLTLGDIAIFKEKRS